jgi:hypothetical protein
MDYYSKEIWLGVLNNGNNDGVRIGDMTGRHRPVGSYNLIKGGICTS